jgi:hypothetical protein
MAPLWGMLLVTVSEYEPAANPTGNCATTLRFVNDTRASAVWAKTTVGASPEGLKLFPVIVIRLFDPFNAVLYTTGTAALRTAEKAVRANGIRLNNACRDMMMLLSLHWLNSTLCSELSQLIIKLAAHLDEMPRCPSEWPFFAFRRQRRRGQPVPKISFSVAGLGLCRRIEGPVALADNCESVGRYQTIA